MGGIAKAITYALGFRHMAKDMGFTFSIDVFSDAIAAIGIARRRGVGKIRHLDTTDLWVQDKIRSGEVRLHKILGTENPADLFTKHLPRPAMETHMQKLNLVKLEGRPDAAPRLSAT